MHRPNVHYQLGYYGADRPIAARYVDGSISYTRSRQLFSTIA